MEISNNDCISRRNERKTKNWIFFAGFRFPTGFVLRIKSDIVRTLRERTPLHEPDSALLPREQGRDHLLTSASHIQTLIFMGPIFCCISFCPFPFITLLGSVTSSRSHIVCLSVCLYVTVVSCLELAIIIIFLAQISLTTLLVTSLSTYFVVQTEPKITSSCYHNAGGIRTEVCWKNFLITPGVYRSSHQSKDQRETIGDHHPHGPHLFSEPRYWLVTQPSLDICLKQREIGENCRVWSNVTKQVIFAINVLRERECVSTVQGERERGRVVTEWS